MCEVVWATADAARWRRVEQDLLPLHDRAGLYDRHHVQLHCNLPAPVGGPPTRPWISSTGASAETSSRMVRTLSLGSAFPDDWQ